MSFGNERNRFEYSGETEDRDRAARARIAAHHLSQMFFAEATTLPPKHVYKPEITTGTNTAVPYGIVGTSYGLASHELFYLQHAAMYRYNRRDADQQYRFHPHSGKQSSANSADLLREQIIRVMAGGSIEPSTLSYVEHDLGLREDPVIEWRDYKNRAALNAINTLLGAYPHLHDIQARLTDLIAMATEEYPETDIPNSAAIGSFSALMQTHKFRVSPRISLTPGGHLVAEWGPSEGRSVAFQFLADSTINFSARIPDDSKGGRLMPTYGATSLTGLYRRISYDPAFSWLSLDGSNAPSAPADTE